MRNLKAALLKEIGEPLRVESVSEPKLGPNDVLVKIRACGLCHSDLHLINGALRLGKLPIVLGHEAAGVVTEVGKEVSEFVNGDDVVIYFYISCGKCRYCKAGYENLCEKVKRIGMDVDGAFAEYVSVPESSLVKLPHKVEITEAALLGCAVGTAYHSLVEIGALRMGESVAIFGVGGIGMSAVQVAKLCGAKILAVDIVEEKLKLAHRLGADFTINAKEEDPLQRIKELTDGKGADLCLECIGLPITIEQAIKSVKKKGRSVLVGFLTKKVSIGFNELILRESSVRGSRGLRKQNLIDLVGLLKEGKLDLKPLITHSYSLEEVNKGFDTLRKGLAIRILLKP